MKEIQGKVTIEILRETSSLKSSKPSFDKPKRTRGTDTPKRGGEKTFDSEKICKR